MNNSTYIQDHTKHIADIQKALNNNLHLLKEYFSETFHVDSSYAEAIVLSRLNQELDYLKLYLNNFVENEQDVSLHFSNIAVSSRNSPLGATLVISDTDPKATLEIICMFLAAKNAVGVYLGPELTKTDHLTKYIQALSINIKILTEEALESMNKDDSFDLIYYIGNKETERSAMNIGGNTRSLTTGVVQSNNVAVVTEDCEDLNHTVTQIFNNKIEL
jgi:hypothetical protein